MMQSVPIKLRRIASDQKADFGLLITIFRYHYNNASCHDMNLIRSYIGRKEFLPVMCVKTMSGHSMSSDPIAFRKKYLIFLKFFITSYTG